MTSKNIILIVAILIIGVMGYFLFKKKKKTPIVFAGDALQVSSQGANVPDWLFDNQDQFHVGDYVFGEDVPGGTPGIMYELTPNGWRTI